MQVVSDSFSSATSDRQKEIKRKTTLAFVFIFATL